jgi:novobiocin biosynthesis protein NovU/D-mycarose 3-C-methyltransferase
VQLRETVPGRLMFKNYLYIPSSSKTRVDHFYELAESLTSKLHTTSKDLVVDIGSNDGSLLQCFAQLGTRILGVDPSENLAKVAELKGVPTVNAFFSRRVAAKIVRKYGKAKIITATNVFAHVDNLAEFVAGIETLLAPDGVFAIEFPYLVDFLKECEFDTIYHEHLSYFAVRPLIKLFHPTKLEIYSIQRMDLDGGSLRVIVQRKKRKSKKTDEIKKLIDLELGEKLDILGPYKTFAKKVIQRKTKFKKLLKQLKSKKKKVIGYGAPAKGNTFINYCHITPKDISYIVDSTSYKQGLFLPGSHIPIYHENKILSNPPDYIVILAWNFADEIIRKNTNLRARGIHFILPHKDFQIV